MSVEPEDTVSSAVRAPAGERPEVLPDVPRPKSVALSVPAGWLRRGWQDAIAFPTIALFYGVCFWLMAAVLGYVFRTRLEYTMMLLSGCLLLGPFLAMGLYDVSRKRERGEPPTLLASMLCWRPHTGSMSILVLVLVVLELLWGRASLVVFAVFSNTAMPSTAGVFHAILEPNNLGFLVTYLAVGGIFAALVYSTSVVSIPMILDRDTDALTAAIASIALVLSNLTTMLWWGLIISALLVGSLMTPYALAIIVVGPVLGHASWHAYRDSIRWEKPRQPH
jgi:uncharacterized membrane protein